jgi:hypothetical protein
MQKKIWRLVGASLLVPILLIAPVFLATSVWPSLGAQGADLLRAALGDERVASLEMVVFRAQDGVQKLAFDLGLAKPAAPWQAATIPIQAMTAMAPQPGNPTSSPPDPTGMAEPVLIQGSTPQAEGILILPTPSPIPSSPTPTPWAPAPLTPKGSLEGEGMWTPYLSDSSGNTLAYRTFLQPDPQRPYAVVALVAFDLTRTRLHYVLGSIEPYNPEAPKRSGKIPEGDLVAGRLLATFNGGFKATHGHFGAMSDGITVLPPRDGLGTLAIYADGSVRIGEWGSEIDPNGDFLAWRQNGPLVIHNGAINPRIYNDSPKDWGYTVDDVSPTLRSGIAISADGNTLYYVAGPRMTMQALAESMLAAGANNGMQLDINNYWVHFVAIDANLKPEPLLPDLMTEFLDRYLQPYTRDYFYVTTK